MKWVKIAIGATIAISVIPTIVGAVTGLTQAQVLDIDGVTVLTPAGALYGTVAGTLIDLAPLIFVASVLAFIFAMKADD